MAVSVPQEVLQDKLAMSLASAMAAANRHARSLGLDVSRYIVSIMEAFSEGEGKDVWRINFGPRDYVGVRGGDLIIDVDQDDASIKRVLKGQ